MYNIDGYRQDCSGYVSMGWQSSTPGHVTWTLQEICTKIDISQIQMGDAILNVDHGHVIMFDKWIDSDAYMAYQEQQSVSICKSKFIIFSLTMSCRGL